MSNSMRRRARLKTCAEARKDTLEGVSPLALQAAEDALTQFAFDDASLYKKMRAHAPQPRTAKFCNEPWIAPKTRVCDAPQSRHSFSLNDRRSALRIEHEPQASQWNHHRVDRREEKVGENEETSPKRLSHDSCCSINVRWDRCEISNAWICAASQRLLILLEWGTHNDLYAFSWHDRRLVFVQQFGRMLYSSFFPAIGCLLYVTLPTTKTGPTVVVAHVNQAGHGEHFVHERDSKRVETTAQRHTEHLSLLRSPRPLSSFGLHLSKWTLIRLHSRSKLFVTWKSPHLTITQLGALGITVRGEFKHLDEGKARELPPCPLVRIHVHALFDSMRAAERKGQLRFDQSTNSTCATRIDPYTRHIPFFSDRVSHPAIRHGWRVCTAFDCFADDSGFGNAPRVLRRRQELRVDSSLPDQVSVEPAALDFLQARERDWITLADRECILVYECNTAHMSLSDTVGDSEHPASMFRLVRRRAFATGFWRIVHFPGSEWAAFVMRPSTTGMRGSASAVVVVGGDEGGDEDGGDDGVPFRDPLRDRGSQDQGFSKTRGGAGIDHSLKLKGLVEGDGEPDAQGSDATLLDNVELTENGLIVEFVRLGEQEGAEHDSRIMDTFVLTVGVAQLGSLDGPYGQPCSVALNAFGDIAILYNEKDLHIRVLVVERRAHTLPQDYSLLRIPFPGLIRNPKALRAQHTASGTFLCFDAFEMVNYQPFQRPDMQVVVQVLPALCFAFRSSGNGAPCVGPRLLTGDARKQRTFDLHKWIRILHPHIGAQLTPIVLACFTIDDAIAMCGTCV